MNKKYVMFGVFAMMAMAFVSAGLVNYLSNESVIGMTTESPLSLEPVAERLGLVYGGAEFETTVTVTNHIDDTVPGVLTTVISNNLDNASCDDFQSIQITVDGGSDDGTVLEGLDFCSGDTLRIPVVYLGNEVQGYDVVGKFQQNVVPANYRLDSQVLIVPTV